MVARRSARRLGLGGGLLVCAVTAALVLAVAARADVPGGLDPSFGHGGIATPGAGSRLFGTAVQGDGKVLAVGEVGTQSGTTLLLARFTVAGSLDRSFGAGGVVKGPAIPGLRGGGSIGRGVAIQADGKIVVVGTVTTSVGTGRLGLLVERYNPNGTLDPSFGTGGVVDALGQSSGDGYAAAIQPDGKIIATGDADADGTGGTAPRVAVVRLNPNGGLDPSFGTGGSSVLDLGAYSYAVAVALAPDGRLVIAGSQAPGRLAPSALVARLTPAGRLDPSFGGFGWYTHQYARNAASSSFNAVAVQSDGKVVGVGAALHGASAADTLVVRYTASGALDPTFASGGVAYTSAAVNWNQSSPTVPGANGVVIAPNGDLVLAGLFANSNTTYATLWALKPGGTLDGAFGHGGAAVLTNSLGENTEFAGIAVSPTDANGEFVAVGDALPPFNGSYAGVGARYLGFGLLPPPVLTGLSGAYRTSSVVRHGLSVGVGYGEACAIQVSLTVGTRTARALHLKLDGNGPVTIASGRVALGGSGTRSITLRLSKAEARAFQRQRRVSLTLAVSVTSASTHRTRAVTHGVTFRR